MQRTLRRGVSHVCDASDASWVLYLAEKLRSVVETSWQMFDLFRNRCHAVLEHSIILQSRFAIDILWYPA